MAAAGCVATITRVRGPSLGQKQIRAVKESTAGSRFGMRGLLIGWLGQAGLYLGQIEKMVVFASQDEGQSGQIRHDGPIAIVAIQTYHGLAQRNRLSFYIRADHFHSPPQLSAVVAVACPRERAQPLMSMCLQDGGTGPDNLATLASEIASSAHLAQPSLRSRAVCRLRQGSLAGGLSRAIHVEDQKVGSPVDPRARLISPP